MTAGVCHLPEDGLKNISYHSSGEENTRNTIISPYIILTFLQSVADMLTLT